MSLLQNVSDPDALVAELKRIHHYRVFPDRHAPSAQVISAHEGLLISLAPLPLSFTPFTALTYSIVSVSLHTHVYVPNICPTKP